MDVLLAKAVRECLKVRDFLAVPGEIAEAVHVVDVQADAVQGDVPCPVSLQDLAHVRVPGIAPAALDVAEGPVGREVALAGEAAKLAADGGWRLLLNKVEREVPAHRGHGHLVHLLVAQVPDDLPGIVQEKAEAVGFGGDNEEIVGGIEALLLLGVDEIIGIPGTVVVAALVDAPHGLPQTI